MKQSGLITFVVIHVNPTRSFTAGHSRRYGTKSLAKANMCRWFDTVVQVTHKICYFFFMLDSFKQRCTFISI